MTPFHIEAKTISDAWFQAVYNLFDHHYIQAIQKGSFEGGQSRFQYPGLSIYIEHPGMDMIPTMPEGSNIPAPTSKETVEDYFANYIMDPSLLEHETYRYSTRIHHKMPKGGTQYDRVIEMLKCSPLTNQAVIEIGRPEDIDTCGGEPPCLRVIDFKVIPAAEGMVLTVSTYWRSWDLWAGLPTNLGGIEMLKEFVALEVGLINGPMYAYSAGAHLYGYQEDVARMRTLRK